MMEYNIQKYQFHQDGKDYVVSTGIVDDRIRITCQEDLSLDGPFYSNEFSLYDLKNTNQFFKLTQTPDEALNEINKGIERQKSALKPGQNDTMVFLGYLVIGTDNDVYKLVLRRDYNPNKYGIFTPPYTGAADLILSTNYHVDGARLILAESKAGELQREESFLEDELNSTIPEINKIKKMCMDIEEENALIKERIRLLQKQLEEKKNNVLRLKEENSNFKRENQNLNNYIKTQENSIREKQIYQTKVRIKQRPNISPGSSAVTSKFEQSALRTFFPRTGAKPITEDYIKNNNYIAPVSTTLITNESYQPSQLYNIPTSYENQLESQYIQPIYQQPQIITPQPITFKVERPIINYTKNSPNILRTSNRSNISGYSNPTYRAYLTTSPKEIIYKNKVYDPNYNRRFDKKDNKGSDLPYSSSNTNINKIKINSYSSQMANNQNKNKNLAYSYSTPNINKNMDTAYNSQLARRNINKDIPYSSGISNQNPNKDVAYSSQMANRTKIDGYSSKMGKMLNSSNNGYSSQMAKTNGNVSQEYKKPIGSRLPKTNYGNYSGKLYGDKNQKYSNNSKINGSKKPEIGYSSYKPDKK